MGVGAEEIFRRWMHINRCNGSFAFDLRAGVECQVGSGCLRPTRLCSYLSGSHHHWASSYHDGDSVGEFIAQDACAVGGVWDVGCKCCSGFTGDYCLDAEEARTERSDRRKCRDSMLQSGQGSFTRRRTSIVFTLGFLTAAVFLVVGGWHVARIISQRQHEM